MLRPVEIIIPSFNASEWLPRSLNAILNQTYPAWRIWFVNDGSTDDTDEVIRMFRKVEPRLYYFKGSNQGVSAARNWAKDRMLENLSTISNSEIPTSDWLVAYCDADDIWHPMHLWDSVSYFDQNPDVDFIYTDVVCQFINGAPAFPYGIPYHEELDLIKLQKENPIYASTVVHKVKCFGDFNFDSRVNGREDHLMWLMFSFMKRKMVHIKKVLTIYTVRNDGVASTWNIEKQKIFNSTVEYWTKEHQAISKIPNLTKDLPFDIKFH